jgi:hypothetical protein
MASDDESKSNGNGNGNGNATGYGTDIAGDPLLPPPASVRRRSGRPKGPTPMAPYRKSARIIGFRVNGPEAATIGAMADVLELQSESEVIRSAIGAYYASLPGAIRNRVDSLATQALKDAQEGIRTPQRYRGIGPREDPRLGFAAAAACKILDKPAPIPRGPWPSQQPKPEPEPGEEFLWL